MRIVKRYNPILPCAEAHRPAYGRPFTPIPHEYIAVSKRMQRRVSLCFSRTITRTGRSVCGFGGVGDYRHQVFCGRCVQVFYRRSAYA